MPIISMQQFKHPDTESDMKHLAPSAEEISNLGITCSNCGAREGPKKNVDVVQQGSYTHFTLLPFEKRYLNGVSFKCHDARYCSRAVSMHFFQLST